MAIVYNSPVLRIHRDERMGIMESEWLGFAGSEELRAGYSEMLRLGRHYQPPGWIANQLAMRTVRPMDQDWIVESFMPAFGHLPLNRFALVSSRDALNRMGMVEVIERSAPALPFPYQFFIEAAEARLWVAEGIRHSEAPALFPGVGELPSASLDV